MTINERLVKHLEKDYSKEERIYFYDFIENYISDNVKDWSKAPNTDAIAASFADVISNMNNSDFSLLLISSGYIPEFYAHDSSQETLYTKLIEVLVCEWAKRVGFVDSLIQKQKASKEDVTIGIGNKVIVCDAKSYRLGRSQAAPNVKDTIKKADYDKWQESYRAKVYKDEIKYLPIGGVITFPSLHRWKGKSDAYLYCTDKKDPIFLMFYEHMAFMLVKKISHERIINVLENYGEVFPEKTKDQHKYFEALIPRLMGNQNEESFIDFIKLWLEITDELIIHKMTTIGAKIKDGNKEVEDAINQLSIDDFDAIKKRLIEAETKLLSNQLGKQLNNITKFRLVKGSQDRKAEESNATPELDLE